MKLRIALMMGAVGLAMSVPGLAEDLPYGADGYYPGDPSDHNPDFAEIKPTGEFPVQTERYQKYMTQLKAGKITPFGAPLAGGEKGIIPAWSCTDKGVPSSLKDVVDAQVLKEAKSHPYPYFTESPYKDEEPRFVVTAENYQQYAEHLTAGAIKLLKSYPDAARIPVYPTHRTACFPQYVYEQTRLNAKYGQSIHNGSGALGIKGGMPFPLPANGYEANWNNLVGMPGLWYYHGHHASIAVFPGGERALQSEMRKDIMYYYVNPYISRADYYEGPTYQSAYLNLDTAPARIAGGGVLGWNRLHKVRHPRVTWKYSPGTRRVRRYPYYGFDTPTGAGGLRGIDESAIWNGPPTRFDVEIVGIKKLIVPYNAYGWDMPDSFDGVIGYPVINPEVTRWELHRMRVIKLTLKEGKNHWYSQRILYQDIDTGHYLLADNYDHQGNLWRTTMLNYVWTPTFGAVRKRATVFYDFVANAYTTAGLINEGNGLFSNQKNLPIEYYGPAKLRKAGFR